MLLTGSFQQEVLFINESIAPLNTNLSLHLGTIVLLLLHLLGVHDKLVLDANNNPFLARNNNAKE
jgi:hypothetical protein